VSVLFFRVVGEKRAENIVVEVAVAGGCVFGFRAILFRWGGKWSVKQVGGVEGIVGRSCTRWWGHLGVKETYCMRGIP